MKTMMMLALTVLGLGLTGCELTWPTVQGYVCANRVCPAPTVDEAIDILVTHGIDVILGDDNNNGG